MNQVNTIVDKNDYMCPITSQIMRDPVIGSDGHTYEETAIRQWIATNPISPVTREPMESVFFPNRYMSKQINDLIINNHVKNQEMYQYNLKDFLNFYIKRFKPKINYPYNLMLNELPLTVDTDKHKYIHSVCGNYYMMCKKYDGRQCYLFDFIDRIIDVDKIFDIINICKMPDRKVLYDILGANHKKLKYPSKMLIEFSSLSDEDLTYLIAQINNGNQNFINFIDPEKHYKLISYNGLKKLIQSMKSVKEFNDFVKQRLKYFNPLFHKYLLHLVLSNDNLIFDTPSGKKLINWSQICSMNQQ